MARLTRLAISMLPLPLALGACTKPAPEAAPRLVADSSTTAPRETDRGRAPVEAPLAPPADAASPVDASSAEPVVRVKLVTIGMHVGGGPYDEVTKEPIKRSVEPHFAELARCWRHVPQPRQADVGVDLVIEANGGRAKVSNPRTTIAGEGFLPCVVTFYEGVDFQKPKHGRTVVSYSVRFLP